MNTRGIKKLKSDRGVSLSVALLFFLVCAILASMLIAAATAANGRAASVIESRQDDSAAVSGARLIADQLQKDVVIIVETAVIDQNGNTTIKDTTYYEAKDSTGAEGKTSLEDFADYKKVTNEADFSVLSASIQTMYSSYLNQISDKSEAFGNGSLAKTGSVSNLKPVKNDMQISVDNNENLTAEAAYTLNPDLSIDIRVSRNKAVCYVHCTPVITTNIAYEAIEEGNPDAGQKAVKTTIVSFAKASVSRS
jgi:hypothetical protein